MLAPGCLKMAHMVASSSQAKPYFVTNTDDGHLSAMRAALHLASVAFSLTRLQLQKVMDCCFYFWRIIASMPRLQRVKPNYTQLSMVNLPRCTAGPKGGKAQTKKTISQRKVTPNEQRQPLSVESLGPHATTSTSAISNIAPDNSTESLSKLSPSVTVITTSSGN